MVARFWAGYAALSITLITGILIFGCAHKLRTVDTREASKKEEWANVEKKHVEQRQNDEQQKKERSVNYRRKTTPTPQGPIVEEEYALTLSELQATSGVVTVSDSQLATSGNRHEKAASKAETMRDTKPGGFSLPWWVHGVVLMTIAGYLGWLLWRSGWRPWKR